ncbi:MAG TPA: SDR family oxidoreductase [Myxococcota bacterium]|jgi:NAD(P)-dependent dehydrogenase (short-subunit alcohol dehydrogenase family)
MELGLNGKSVVVTGGSGGIGRGLVQEFAREGARVVIATRDAKQGQVVADACAGLAGEAALVRTDVTDRASVEAMAAEAERRFGPIDVLVNNAGGVAYPRSFLDKPLDEAEWEVNLNVWGVFHCTRVVGAGMVARKRGAIVNITSNSALVPAAGNMVATYAGTKGFVMSFSKALAFEWGPLGVRVNCVAPGWIVPHQQDHVGEGSFWKKYGYEFFGTPEQMAAAAESGNLFNVESQPIRRIGRPEDIANITMFLASERAAHLTGQLVSVSGGAYMP